MSDVIVVGVRTSDADGFGSLGGMNRFGGGSNGEYTPDTVSGDGGGEAHGKSLMDVLQDFVKYILEKYFDKVAKPQDQRETDERTISSQFNPSNVAADGSFTTNDGEAGRMWAMNDGTVFWDTNGNGKPDFHTKFGSDGKLYGDDGSGFGLLE